MIKYKAIFPIAQVHNVDNFHFIGMRKPFKNTNIKRPENAPKVKYVLPKTPSDQIYPLSSLDKY